MGAKGLYIPRNPADIMREPLTGRVGDFENKFREGASGIDIEHGALYAENGEPIVGYKGDEDSTPIDRRVLNTPNGTFSHFHPDENFGGTLSLADLKVFAKSQLGELRAVAPQGQLYTIKAGNNIDRQALGKWVNRVEPIAVKNFRNSYKTALKQATTPLKSGPHKGQIKLTTRKTVTDANGNKRVVSQNVYRQPMTAKQADNYARRYSLGAFERMYKKNLSKFGVTYSVTKGGRAGQAYNR